MSSPPRHLVIALSTFALALGAWPSVAHAQPREDPSTQAPQPLPPPNAPAPAPVDPNAPAPSVPEPTVEPPTVEPGPAPMSEGRRLVSLYNSGVQWSIAPGVVFVDGRTGFFLGLRFGYGIDTGSVIVVPGVQLAGYIIDPNVYVGMPMTKLVLPIDRFAPFVQGGAGVGQISSSPSQTGVAVMAGGGFMLHFSPRFALGAEATYQVITGTGFKGLGVGPILAIGL